MEEKPKTANAMSKVWGLWPGLPQSSRYFPHSWHKFCSVQPRRALSVKSRLEPLEGTRGVGPKLRATASGRDLVPMMEESASFSQQFVTVRPTASDGDMTSLITTTKQRALEAAVRLFVSLCVYVYSCIYFRISRFVCACARTQPCFYAPCKTGC